MKKLFLVLLVVAMSAFLFVGCLPGVTPEPEPEPEPEPTPTPATVAPIIIGVTGGAYINAAEAAANLIVIGTAPTYSEVKIYINDICAGTGDTLADGTWIVVVAKADLGADGAKTLYATAKEAALDVSAKSNEKTFTLDTVIPSIASSRGTAGTAAVTTAVLTYQTLDGTVVAPPNDTALFTAALFDATQLIAGVVDWKIEILTIDIAGDATLKVTNLTAGTSVNYTFVNPAAALVATSNSWIPGATVTVSDSDTTAVGGLDPLTDIGAYCLVTTTNTVVLAGFIDVTFDEVVTGASVLAGVWTAFAATTNILPAVTVRSSTVARLTETAAGIPNLVAGVAYSVSCSGIIDLAGNPIPAAAPSQAIGIVIP